MALPAVSAIGFTGTRTGMTPAQTQSTQTLLKALAPNTVHYGMCQGADADFARLAHAQQCRLVGHPGYDHQGKSPLLDATTTPHEQRPVLAYALRNANIVKSAQMVLACPPSCPLPVRGGTRMTINMARRNGVPIIVVWPNGSVTATGRTVVGDLPCGPPLGNP